MRHSTKREAETARAETRMLGGMTLVCYSTTLAAVLVFGYALLALALRGVAVPELVTRSCACF
jgi:hypothetical protein